MTVTVTLTFTDIAEAVRELSKLAPGVAVGPVVKPSPAPAPTETPATDKVDRKKEPSAGNSGAAPAPSRRTAGAGAADAPAPSTSPSAGTTKQQTAGTADANSASPPATDAAASYNEVKNLVTKVGAGLVAKYGPEGRAKLLEVAKAHGGDTFLALQGEVAKHPLLLKDLRELAAEHEVTL